MDNYEFNKLSKNSKPLNKINKQLEKDNLKISLSNKNKEISDNRHSSNQIGILIIKS